MSLSLFRTALLVVPLVGLGGLMAVADDTDGDVCSGMLAFAKSYQIMADDPSILEFDIGEFHWISDCSFAMDGISDVQTASGIRRVSFELVVSREPMGRWRQTDYRINR